MRKSENVYKFGTLFVNFSENVCQQMVLARKLKLGIVVQSINTNFCAKYQLNHNGIQTDRKKKTMKITFLQVLN